MKKIVILTCLFIFGLASSACQRGQLARAPEPTATIAAPTIAPSVVRIAPAPPPVAPATSVATAPATRLPNTPERVATVSAMPTSLRLIKKIAITTEAEHGSARPEIVAMATRVFVVYLGNISVRDGRRFNLKIYDTNMEQVIASKTLVSTTTQYGGPTDLRVASDDRFLYAFYETHKPTSPTTGATYLWGAKYTLDDRFDRVAYTATPITSSKSLAELQDGGELLDDPAPLIGTDTVFVVTRLKHTLAKSGKTIYRVREFRKEDLKKLSEFDLDLSAAADGRARVASLQFWNDKIIMALPTTVADQGIIETADDGAPSDVIVVRMNRDWTFDARKDVKIISAESNDRENYVAGLKTAGNYLYVTYKQSAGSPPAGQHIAWIKIFDKDFNLVLQEQIKSTGWGPGGGSLRPSLEVGGNRIFSGQSGGQGLGQGNAEIYVYEINNAKSRQP